MKYRSAGNYPIEAYDGILVNRAGKSAQSIFDGTAASSTGLGTVLSSAGAGMLNYGVRNLITVSTSKMRWKFRLDQVDGAGTTRYLCGEYNTTGNKRCWEFQLNNVNNRVLVLLGNNGGTSASVNSAIGTYVPITGDLIDIVFDTGVFTMTVNGGTSYTLDASATQTVIYNNNSPEFNVAGSRSSSTSSYNGKISDVKIWVGSITDNDTPVFHAPLAGSFYDLVNGWDAVKSGTLTWSISATASFYPDINGFMYGTTLIGYGGGCLNYGVRGLITTSTSKMRWKFKLDTITSSGAARVMMSEYASTGDKRCWYFNLSVAGTLNIVIGNSGGTANAVSLDTGHTPVQGEVIDITWNAGIIILRINGYVVNTFDQSAIQTLIYNNNGPELNIMGYLSSSTSSFSGSISGVTIWVDSILDSDTPKFRCCYMGRYHSEISGVIPSIVGTLIRIPQIKPRLYTPGTTFQVMNDGAMALTGVDWYTALRCTLTKETDAERGQVLKAALTAGQTSMNVSQYNSQGRYNTAGRTVTVSYWIKAEGSAIGKGVLHYVTASSYITVPGITLSASWQPVTYTVDNYERHFGCYPSTALTDGAVLYLDDISVTVGPDDYPLGAMTPYTEVRSREDFVPTATASSYDIASPWFDKSNADIWSDELRALVHYDTDNPYRWNVEELYQTNLYRYGVAAYRGKIISAIYGDYCGGLFVFDTPTVSITAPEGSDNVVLDTDFTVSGKALAVNVKIVAFKSGGAEKTLSASTATAAGEYSKADCQLLGTDFTAGDAVTIRVYSLDNPAVYADVAVVAASGVFLTALQITNASDAAAKGDTYINSMFFEGENIIIGGYTTSTKIKIKDTNYSSGLSATSYRKFVLSVTKKHEINWINFYDCYFPPNSKAVCSYNNYIYTVDMGLTGGYITSKIYKINPADGAQTSLALTTAGSTARALYLDAYNGYLYAFGFTQDGSGAYTLWKVAASLGSQSKVSNSGGSNYIYISGFISSGRAYANPGNAPTSLCMVDFTNAGVINSAGAFSAAYAGNADVSSTRFLIMEYTSPNGCAFLMRSATDLSSVYSRQQFSTENTSLRIGSVKFDGTDFLAFYNDGTKYYLTKIADSDTYTKTAVTDFTPNAQTVVNTNRSAITYDSTHYVVAGGVKGNVEAGFTPGDNTKYDAFIKLIAK